MKTINVIMYYPKEESATDYIMKVTTQTYLKSVLKVLDKSCLTIIEKKELIDRKIASGT